MDLITRSHELAGCWPLRSAPAPKNSVVTSYVACTDNDTVSVSNLFAPGHASSSSHSVVPSYLKLQINVASLMLIQKRMPTLKVRPACSNLACKSGTITFRRQGALQARPLHRC